LKSGAAGGDAHRRVLGVLGCTRHGHGPSHLITHFMLILRSSGDEDRSSGAL